MDNFSRIFFTILAHNDNEQASGASCMYLVFSVNVLCAMYRIRRSKHDASFGPDKNKVSDTTWS